MKASHSKRASAADPGGQLLIFDCDGVLVDSETISAEVMATALAGDGLPIDGAFVYNRFLGRSMDAVREVLAQDFAYDLTDIRLDNIRRTMQARLTSELAAVPGIAAALDALATPKCVASSSRPERIRLSLKVTGLLHHFEPHIYSATMVKSGKPAPDLFLHAAREMGHGPESCVVIEDSPAGVEAAKRAGMRVFGFVGGAHAQPSSLHSALAALAPDIIFDDMIRLPELLAEEPQTLE